MADPVEFMRSLGTAAVVHNSGDTFDEHLLGVRDVMASWTSDAELVNAALFHSIYGTEGFQAFTVPLSQRSEVEAVIGRRAEFIAYVNCVMDRATLDATLAAPLGQHSVLARPEVGGAATPLTDGQFRDLITVHLADWLQQVEKEAAMPNLEHGWVNKGDAWGYRRGAYSKMAALLGGPALAMYNEVFAREPEHTRCLDQPQHPTKQEVQEFHKRFGASVAVAG